MSDKSTLNKYEICNKFYIIAKTYVIETIILEPKNFDCFCLLIERNLEIFEKYEYFQDFVDSLNNMNIKIENTNEYLKEKFKLSCEILLNYLLSSSPFDNIDNDVSATDILNHIGSLWTLSDYSIRHNQPSVGFIMNL